MKSSQERPTETDLAALMSHMRGNGWLTAADLAIVTGWSERFVRRVISLDSHGCIISGQLGYKVTVESSRDEIDSCINHLTSRARELLRRVTVLQQYIQNNV